MLPFFPFSETFDLKMGTSPLADPEHLIERDEHYHDEVNLKRKLFNSDQDYYFRAAPNTEDAQWEVVSIVLNSLVKASPSNFILHKNQNQWTWENKVLNEKIAFQFGVSATLPLPPLCWAGLQVQEDLLILDKELTLIAGSLCFPSGWDLNEKFGKHFLTIHAPLPALTSPMIEAAGKFISKIPAGKAFQRNNWGFRINNWLDLSAKHTPAYLNELNTVSREMTEDNAGEKIYVRVEHQTLSRLSNSNHILFTIHTYQNLLKNEVEDPTKARTLHSFLKSVPTPLLEYKAMAPFAEKLISYLKTKGDI
jgi:dimethylamine monooxygenase subunit A